MRISLFFANLVIVLLFATSCKSQSETAQSLFDSPLSAEADAFLAACNTEYNEKQQELYERFLAGVERYDVDLVRGVASFRKESGALIEFDVQEVGSASHSTNTWEWAWNNPNVSEELSRASGLVKPIGEKYGLRYLTTGFVPIPEENFPAYLSGIALKVSGALGVYRAQHEDLDIYLLLSNPREAQF